MLAVLVHFRICTVFRNFGFFVGIPILLDKTFQVSWIYILVFNNHRWSANLTVAEFAAKFSILLWPWLTSLAEVCL
jgi:hypothetical protein